MSKLKLADSEIYYKEYGKGAPLLLIAGLGSDSTSWLPVIIGLSKHYRVIVFDHRGVGQSTEDNSGITIENMVSDTVSLIKGLSLSKTNVLGHSMGGMIAMKLAIDYPELVDKLILCATSTKVNNRNKNLFTDMVANLISGMDKRMWFRNLFYWILSPDFFEDSLLLDQVVNMAINYRYPQSDKSFENQVNAIIDFNCTDEIDGIQCSTLIMFGGEDILFPKLETEKILSRIPENTSVTLLNTAHSIHVDNPQGFINEVVGFI